MLPGRCDLAKSAGCLGDFLDQIHHSDDDLTLQLQETAVRIVMLAASLRAPYPWESRLLFLVHVEGTDEAQEQV